MNERFWSKVEKTDTCWLWTASVTPDGYGHLRFGDRWDYAHRVSYELLVGPIPEGLQIDHLCRVRACVRPDHLEPVTVGENVRRGIGNPNKRKTHCARGHEFTPENTYRWDGHRTCRTCRRIYKAAWRRSKV